MKLNKEELIELAYEALECMAGNNNLNFNEIRNSMDMKLSHKLMEKTRASTALSDKLNGEGK